MIIMTLKGAEIYYNLITTPKTVSNTYVHVAKASHVQHIQPCHVKHAVCHVVPRNSWAINFYRVCHIYFHFILLAETIH